MKKFEYEKAHDLFVSKLGGEVVNVDKYGFSREFKFTASGIDYGVIWFHNQSTILINDMRVMFFDAEIANTWPSPPGAKSKLQLYDDSGNCVAVIVLDWH